MPKESGISAVIKKAAALKERIDKAKASLEKLMEEYTPLAEQIIVEADKVATPTETGGRKGEVPGDALNALVSFPAASLKLTAENKNLVARLLGPKFAKLTTLVECPFQFVKEARAVAKALLTEEKLTALYELAEKPNAPRVSYRAA